jgi:hypothetical protein
MSSKRCLRRQGRYRPSRRISFSASRSCEHKEPHATWDLAEQALHQLMSTNYFDGGEMNVYRCPINREHFHYGHRPDVIRRSKHDNYRT